MYLRMREERQVQNGSEQTLLSLVLPWHMGEICSAFGIKGLSLGALPSSPDSGGIHISAHASLLPCKPVGNLAQGSSLVFSGDLDSKNRCCPSGFTLPCYVIIRKCLHGDHYSCNLGKALTVGISTRVLGFQVLLFLCCCKAQVLCHELQCRIQKQVGWVWGRICL